MTRQELQQTALEAFLESKRASVILPTGSGKTKVGVDCHMALGSKNTLVLCPKRPLINQWKDSFNKFGNISGVEINTLQSCYKKKLEVEFLIIDEAHRALSDEYKKVFENIKYKYLLCLTATLPRTQDRVMLLEYYAPVVFKKPLSEVRDFEFTPNFTVYNLAVKMDKKTDSSNYTYSKMFSQSAASLAKFAREEGISIFDFAKKYRTVEGHPQKSLCSSYWFGMTSRRKAVLNNEAKLDAIKAVVDKYPTKKFLILVHTEAYAKLVSAKISDSIVYASSQKDKVKEKTLAAFKQGKFKRLIGIDALNEGFDDPEIFGAICVSGNSSTIVGTQQVGRILRISKDSKIFVNIYAKGSVEESWLTARLDGLSSLYIKSINEIN